MGETCSSCREDDYVQIIQACDIERDTFESIVSSFYHDRWVASVNNNTWVGVKYVLTDDATVINNIVDESNGEIALHMAVRNCNYAMIEFLCDHEADIDYQSHKSGQTPLHIAAIQNDVRAIELLVRSGANVNIQTHQGKIAQDLCNANVRRTLNAMRSQKPRRIGWKPNVDRITSKLTNKRGKYQQRDFAQDGDIEFLYQEYEHNIIWQHIINNFGDLETRNAMTNANTITYKRMILKKREIESRNDYVTLFGYKCGFEVDEIALYLDRLSKESREKLWVLLVQGNDATNIVSRSRKFKHVTTIIQVICLKFARKYTTYVSTPEKYTLMTRLASKLKARLPKETFILDSQPSLFDSGAKRAIQRNTLRKDDFVNGQIAIWLYQIHHSQDWQGEVNKKHLEWRKERIIWIGFYNNDDNEKCLIGLLPKDIVLLILEFLQDDYYWSLQQLFVC